MRTSVVYTWLLLAWWTPLLGVEVKLYFPTGQEFLPSSWTRPPISAEIEPLNPKDEEFVSKVMTLAVKKYPGSLVDRHLREIRVVGALRFYGVSYGGTYMANSKRIVLVYRDSFDPVGFEQRLHHEMSSILLTENEGRFEKSRWVTANEPGFRYRAGGIIEEQKGDRSEATKALEAEQRRTGGSGSSLLKLDEALMKQGFLTAYNRVSVEQDVNELAAHLFTNGELWDLCVRFPRIDQKVDVLIDFYRGLDPRMDRIYFRNLTRTPQVLSGQ